MDGAVINPYCIIPGNSFTTGGAWPPNPFKGKPKTVWFATLPMDNGKIIMWETLTTKKVNNINTPRALNERIGTFVTFAGEERGRFQIVVTYLGPAAESPNTAAIAADDAKRRSHESKLEEAKRQILAQSNNDTLDGINEHAKDVQHQKALAASYGAATTEPNSLPDNIAKTDTVEDRRVRDELVIEKLHVELDEKERGKHISHLQDLVKGNRSSSISRPEYYQSPENSSGYHSSIIENTPTITDFDQLQHQLIEEKRLREIAENDLNQERIKRKEKNRSIQQRLHDFGNTHDAGPRSYFDSSPPSIPHDAGPRSRFESSPPTHPRAHPNSRPSQRHPLAFGQYTENGLRRNNRHGYVADDELFGRRPNHSLLAPLTDN